MNEIYFFTAQEGIDLINEALSEGYIFENGNVDILKSDLNIVFKELEEDRKNPKKRFTQIFSIGKNMPEKTFEILFKTVHRTRDEDET